MELETINKLYLELSQFATAKTANEIKLEQALKYLSENAGLTYHFISKLILGEGDEKAEIFGGLMQDFKTNTHSFNIKQKDGQCFSVSIRFAPLDSEQ